MKLQRRKTVKADKRPRIAAAKDSRFVKSGKFSWTGFFCGATILVWGLYLLYLIGTDVYNLARTRDWQTTDCIVLSIQSKGKPSYKGPAKYLPVINYSYRLAGNKYIGNQFEIIDPPLGRDEMDEILMDYQPGTHFSCFYNPQNPNESFAARRSVGHRLFGYVVTLLMYLGFAVLLWKSRNR